MLASVRAYIPTLLYGIRLTGCFIWIDSDRWSKEELVSRGSRPNDTNLARCNIYPIAAPHMPAGRGRWNVSWNNGQEIGRSTNRKFNTDATLQKGCGRLITRELTGREKERETSAVAISLYLLDFARSTSVFDKSIICLYSFENSSFNA